MRLIDVDEFDFVIPADENEDFKRGCEYAMKRLQKAPTAYDVDKIIKKLEKSKQDIAIGQLKEIGCELGQKMNEVKESLEKQMAKKPTNEFHKKYTRHMGDCPNCKSGISSRKLYCPYCGQKIDWSVEND